jgi:hypothetical protein
MKKFVSSFVLTLIVSISTISSEKFESRAAESVICPSGDKFICVESHGELGTIYIGSGKVIVMELQ